MTMTTEELRQKLPEIIVAHVGAVNLTMDSRFVEDIGCDSLDVVELTMDFEEKFDIEIADWEMESVNTVGQAVDLIAKKINAK